ncbi:molybdopterin biosynthesis protein [Deferribacter desulfuricans SSM1]|uniref:Molybdopterin molybdenumtransferase n=1 Tax=Deferribacter desulfuricans (strain DSM 14783 / JCM 11476 / NBRC 101012 / SSM1) TaxID=639282 RepID=D3PCH6_DEFDS|nr:molybdopterin-binding protein [Deferribacter desulfuricans]BAI80299.1 molybdopterin biosynthesis protein [Deferribacter desulfuricans SSM1]
MFRKVKIEDAVGLKLAHDITEVNLDKNFKGVAYKRGYKIKNEDIEHFKSLGKYFVYVMDEETLESVVHEDDAAKMLAPLIAGENIDYDKPSEGKVNFYAKINGLLKVDKEKIIAINRLQIPSLPTKHSNIPVKEGEVVAAFRIIPLYCDNSIIEKVKEILVIPSLDVIPFKFKKAGVIVTGNEVYYGKITDKFLPKISSKLKKFDVEVIKSDILPDEKDVIVNKIKEYIKDVDILFITGGTSVDPDDNTKLAIREAGIDIIQEGNPIQPGNNFTIGYYNDIPVCAVPAAALFYKATALDIFLPRLIAGDKISVDEIAEYSIGGLCHFCKVCVFPVCPFGKA